MALQLTVISLDFESNEAPSVTTFAKDEITIGRAQKSDLVLGSQAVSDMHAKIRVESKGKDHTFYITDLGSTNGTNIGTRRIEPNKETKVSASERIVIADFLIKPVFLVDAARELAEVNQQQTITHVVNGPDIITSETTEAEEVAEQPDSSVKKTEKKPDLRLAHKSEEAKNLDRTSPLTESSESDSQAQAELTTSAANRETSTRDFNTSEYASKSGAPVPTREVVRVSPVSLSGKVGAQDVVELNFLATKLFTLSGKAVHKGKPLAGVEIDGGELGRITTDSSGSFCFRNVKEGSPYTLHANRKKYILAAKSPSDTLREDREVLFEATELFTVSGRIIHNGKPLANVIVDGGKLGETRTDSNGVYEFKNVPEGTEYSVTPKIDGFLIESAA